MPLRAPILQPGRNCWRIENAERVAFLVDGDAYFRAVRTAMERAERSILVLGWDIDSRIQLPRGTASEPLPARLGAFLDTLVQQRPRLEAHVLIWDFAMIYALEREWLPIYKFQWQTNRRLHFRMDDKHPPGASHHQKVVVVDDAVAFVGGFDLSKWRWDTPDHTAKDPRRVDPDGNRYPPFHDVQMAVEGDVAAALGELARHRWERAGGKPIDPPPRPSPSPWPAHVHPDLYDIPVAIARTEPLYRNRPEVREVEHLYLDVIASARRYIYIENQYLSSQRICDAIAERLCDNAGPEVIMVLPAETGGWLEQHTMDVLRSRVLKGLLEADRYHRLRVYYPETPGARVNVHSKLMIVDDRVVRIGSSNLSNRSMGLDTECDLAVEAGRTETTRAIVAFRDRLLGEHLGRAPREVTAAVERHGSLIEAVESLRGGERTLRDLDGRVTPEVDSLVPDATLIDPERPMDPERLVERFVDDEAREPAGRHLLRNAFIIAAVVAFAVAWRWTPLSEWADMETLMSAAGFVKESLWAPIFVIAGFVVAGLVAVPVTLLIVATLLTFEPLPAFFYSLAGATLSAMAGYGLGHLLGRDIVRRFAGRTINRLSRRLASRGVLTVIAIRILPVAPYTVVNMVAGASHIRFRDFVIGTVFGLLPGVTGLILLVDSLAAVAHKPAPESIALLAAVAGGIIAVGYAIRRWILRRAATETSAKEV